jgi:hypothetical protein
MLQAENHLLNRKPQVSHHIIEDKERINSDHEADRPDQEPPKLVLEDLSCFLINEFHIITKVAEEVEPVDADQNDELVEDFETVCLGGIEGPHHH